MNTYRPSFFDLFILYEDCELFDKRLCINVCVVILMPHAFFSTLR